MAVGLAIMGVASFYRLLVTIKGPHTMWRWSFTVATVALSAAMVCYAYPARIDAFLGPNTGVLLHQVLTIVCGGGVSVYVLTLAHERPPGKLIVAVLAGTPIVVIVQIVSWAMAPVHQVSYADIGAQPAASGFLLTFYGTIGVVNATAATATARFLQRPNYRDPSRVAGLVLVTLSTASAAAVCVGFCVRALVLIKTGRDVRQLQVLGDTFIPFVLIGIGLGTCIFLAGPGLVQLQRNKKTIRLVEPLWQRLRDSYPAVHLPYTSHLQSDRHKVERMMIEVHDALELLTVERHRDPYEGVVAAIVGLPEQKPGQTASAVLPQPQTPDEDDAQVLHLALCYNASHAL